jgi:hypothetical protein
MSHLFSISSDYAVHGVHDINKLRMLSAGKARQRLDRTPKSKDNSIRGKKAKTMYGMVARLNF